MFLRIAEPLFKVQKLAETQLYSVLCEILMDKMGLADLNMFNVS
jgi:hypothetical protein